MGLTRIAIVQLDEGGAQDPHVRLEHMAAGIERHADADLVVFPEHALYGHVVADGPPSTILELIGDVRREEIRALDALAAKHSTSVIYGELVGRAGRVHNLATFTNGSVRISYAKSHVHWTEAFEPGQEFPVIRNFAAPLGMLICFDAAFPEVPRLLALRGAHLIVNISAIPASFPLKHVHRRVVACSVDNQLFTVFANRAGKGFRGGSMVVDPTGEIVGTAEETGDLVVDVDLAAVERWRSEEPLFAHRRPGLYADIAR